jgi:hypothetical protein
VNLIVVSSAAAAPANRTIPSSAALDLANMVTSSTKLDVG